jgi:hypothetical protein
MTGWARGVSASTTVLDTAHEMGYVILIDRTTHNRRLGDITRFLPGQTGLDFVHD